MCCTRLAENTRRKNSLSALCAPSHNFVGLYIFPTKACIDNRKNLLNHNISSTCLHDIVNFGPLTAEIGWRVWVGAPLQLLTSLNGRQSNFAWCLAVFWAGTLYIHFRGLLPSNGMLSGAKFTLRPSLAFFYIGNVTARHSSSGRQPNCGVQQTSPPTFGRTAIALGTVPHSSLLCNKVDKRYRPMYGTTPQMYTVSQKTSHFWVALILTYMIRLW